MANGTPMNVSPFDTVDYLAILGSVAGIVLIALLLAKLFGWL